MALRKAPYWTDLYYKVLEEYFWRPQDIGRKSDPSKPSRPWSFWRGKLAVQETPLNHMLDFLFHISPPGLLDACVSDFLGKSVSGYELMEAEKGVIPESVVQPDIILSDGNHLLFVEMKVDSKSSVDQFVKYAIAAECLSVAGEKFDTVDLVLLTKEADHMKVWMSASKLGLNDSRAVKSVALDWIAKNGEPFKQKGVKKYMKQNPGSESSLERQVKNLNLRLTDYHSLATTLRQYADDEPGVARLVDGTLAELRRRDLIG